MGMSGMLGKAYPTSKEEEKKKKKELAVYVNIRCIAPLERR